MRMKDVCWSISVSVCIKTHMQSCAHTRMTVYFLRGGELTFFSRKTESRVGYLPLPLISFQLVQFWLSVNLKGTWCRRFLPSPTHSSIWNHHDNGFSHQNMIVPCQKNCDKSLNCAIMLIFYSGLKRRNMTPSLILWFTNVCLSFWWLMDLKIQEDLDTQSILCN